MRLFYCPVHGRVTDEEFPFNIKDYPYKDGVKKHCEHCAAWYYGLAKKKAKRPGES